jgi:hypothetical protein
VDIPNPPEHVSRATSGRVIGVRIDPAAVLMDRRTQRLQTSAALRFTARKHVEASASGRVSVRARSTPTMEGALDW